VYVTDPILLHLNQAEEVVGLWRLWRLMEFLVERPHQYGERRKDRAGICAAKFTILCVDVKGSEVYKEDTKSVSRVSVLEGSRPYGCCVQHRVTDHF
jgi:hypothetical protein